MNGMKFNAALIFAVILQAIGLVWYVSKIDSKVNIDFLKEQVSKLQIDVEKLIRKNGAH